MVGDILIMIVAWIGGRFLPWSLLVSLALWWGKSKISFKRSRVLLLLFWGGIEDISRIDYLGVRSLLLITLMFIAWMIARHYQNRQLWWWYGLAIMGQGMMMLLDNQMFSLKPLILQVIFLVLVEIWSKRFGRQDTIYVQN